MTLNQKYCDLIDNDNGFDNQLLADKCEKITENFAIGFAEWLNGLDINDEVLQKHISTKELLEIYKREV